MRTIEIERPPTELDGQLTAIINNKTKPLGSLGALERVALKIARIQQTTEPTIHDPTLMVFAGDHGIVAEGVSAYPSEVTGQMVLNYLAGGAAVNVFARHNGLQLMVIDAGVDHCFEPHPSLVDRKVALGTANMLHDRAMTRDQCEEAMDSGAELVARLRKAGCNLVGFGEMGIGNTSSAALLTAILCEMPLADCVGGGAGLDKAGRDHKLKVLQDVIARHRIGPEPLDVMCCYGGFELAMMSGAMLEAARRGMVILIDGVIVTAAFLFAQSLAPHLKEYCIFTHCSAEAGHRKVLDTFGAEPLLDLGLRLGEGTGVALAYPLIRAAVAFLNEMASFDSAGVSKKA